MAALTDIAGIMLGSELEEHQRSSSSVTWCLEELEGRLVEVRSVGPAAALSVAIGLVVNAQRTYEPTAWINATGSMFFPSDAVRNGVDLRILPIVQADDTRHAAVMADKLLRCGAFGLIVLDLGDDPWFPDALQQRLARGAEESATAVVCLTEERRDMRPLGSLVSLRVEATRTRGGFELRATRDRRRGPGWTHREERHGTVGMR